MLSMHFFTRYGYGDFISNLALAHNVRIKYQMPISANFYIYKGFAGYYDARDPETVIDRIKIINNDLIAVDNLDIIIKKTKQENNWFRWINHLERKEICHSYWASTRPLYDKGYVLIWRSKFNTFDPGIEKDPIKDDWEELIQYLEQKGFNVKEVTYRTPVKIILDLIANCSFGIGYDGMIHQLFKIYHKPILVFCLRHELQKALVPHAALETNITDFFKNGLDYYIDLSDKRKQEILDKHKKWLHAYRDPRKDYNYNRILKEEMGSKGGEKIGLL